jgi:hypothetical protein
MEQLLDVFDSNNDLSLRECIYRLREWAKIDNKILFDHVDFSKRLEHMAQFVDDLTLSSPTPTPCDSELKHKRKVTQSPHNKKRGNNIMYIFSSILDIFLRTGRKQLKTVVKDNYAAWSDRIYSLLQLLICDYKKTNTCLYRSSDITAVVKQLNILHSSRMFSTTDIETWIAKLTNLRDISHKQPHISSSSKSTQPFSSSLGTTNKHEVENTPSHSYSTSHVLAKTCDTDGSVLKRQKTAAEEPILIVDPPSPCVVTDEPGGGLAVYRVCYLIEILCKRLKLSLVAQQLAQEIFHSFIILSHQFPGMADSGGIPMTRTFSDYNIDELHLHKTKGSSSDTHNGIDMTIRHYSTTDDANVQDNTVSDFWLYLDNTACLAPPIIERKCEVELSSIAVAAIHLANKAIIDTADAFVPPRLSTMLRELKEVLGSASTRSLLYENQNNAFVYLTDPQIVNICNYEKKFLYLVQYDVTYWSGTVTSTVIIIKC